MFCQKIYDSKVLISVSLLFDLIPITLLFKFVNGTTRVVVYEKGMRVVLEGNFYLRIRIIWNYNISALLRAASGLRRVLDLERK